MSKSTLSEIDRLIIWLRDQSKYRYVLGRVHVLNLWDWEVDMLLAELEDQKKERG